MERPINYNSIGDWLKKRFGRKTIKLAIDAGFTCPNRDGTLGTGGCTFCSPDGSGELAAHLDSEERLSQAIRESIDRQIAMLRPKWHDAAHLAYFQSHTNTYAPAAKLRRLYYTALDDPRIDGIAIATRPDCLGIDKSHPEDGSEILDLLEEINCSHFMWVELGLQSTSDDTLDRLHTCYHLEDYRMAAKALTARHIPFVTHLILGLPGEDKQDMIKSVRYVCDAAPQPFGVKLHLMNLVKGSALALKCGASDLDHPGSYEPYFSSIDEYTDLVVELLEIIPPDITIHRLTGDVPRSMLISPEWSYRKRTILNTINGKLWDRNTWQGKKR